ncbi:uncharacterized protein LOC143885096 isoform X6 [Tasmannia lanceolata]|uniref:uncharacterized protein LOC143885096 isoform X6 n=1 Tax=Tasmannia lanceolata TaxID=3420 RepID=UPI004064BA4B
MRRQGQYVDSGVNPLVAAQMQHMSAQRMQHNHLPARSDSLPIDDEHKYIASKAEAQWQWDRNGPKGSNPLSSHLYKEGQASDASRSLFQGQRLESRSSLEKQANKDLRAQSHEQDMEVGYEENSPAQTFEGLEKKFLDEIMKLAKEQQEAEDAEIARHREDPLTGKAIGSGREVDDLYRLDCSPSCAILHSSVGAYQWHHHLCHHSIQRLQQTSIVSSPLQSFQCESL